MLLSQPSCFWIMVRIIMLIKIISGKEKNKRIEDKAPRKGRRRKTASLQEGADQVAPPKRSGWGVKAPPHTKKEGESGQQQHPKGGSRTQDHPRGDSSSTPKPPPRKKEEGKQHHPKEGGRASLYFTLQYFTFRKYNSI